MSTTTPHTCHSDEASLIGSALFDTTAYRQASVHMTSEAMHNTRNRAIWWTLEKMDSAGTLAIGRDPMPAIAVASTMSDTHLREFFGDTWTKQQPDDGDSLLAYVGGHATLLDAAQMATKGGVERAARNIGRLWRERNAWKQLQRCAKRSGEPGASPLALALSLADDIRNLSATERVSVSDIVSKGLETGDVIGSWGIERMDRHMPLTEGFVYGIVAYPGCGKSSLGIQIAAHTAVRGNRSALISLEMTREVCAQIATRHYSPRELELMDIDETDLSVTELGQCLRKHAVNGARVIVIDHMHFLKRERGEGDYEGFSRAADLVRVIAKREKIAVVMLLQPKKSDARRGKKAADDEEDCCRRPTRGCISGTSQFEVVSHGLIGIWRQDPGQVMDARCKILLMKNRHGQQGQVSVMFNGPTQKFSDEDPPKPKSMVHDKYGAEPSDDENLFA